MLGTLHLIMIGTHTYACETYLLMFGTVLMNELHDPIGATIEPMGDTRSDSIFNY